MWQPAFAHNSGNTSHRAVKTLHPVTTDYSIFPLTGTESAVATSIRKHFEETIMHNLVCYRKINSCSCSQYVSTRATKDHASQKTQGNFFYQATTLLFKHLLKCTLLQFLRHLKDFTLTCNSQPHDAYNRS